MTEAENKNPVFVGIFVIIVLVMCYHVGFRDMDSTTPEPQLTDLERDAYALQEAAR